METLIALFAIDISWLVKLNYFVFKRNLNCTGVQGSAQESDSQTALAGQLHVIDARIFRNVVLVL
jgi:hypothetical protein